MRPMQDTILVTAFYKFFPIAEADVPAMQKRIDEKGQEVGIHGLVLTATEGINGTVAGEPSAIETFKEFLEEIAPGIECKDSWCGEQPFKRWFVKIRKEIVAIGDKEVLPESEDHNHITPTEWNRMMEEEDVVVLDTRNTYETEIGTFEGAIDPRLDSFDQFRGYVEQCGIPKDKKVLMFCTGGIRCEKACLEMERQGYQHVYQLKGGILKYFEQYPDKHFNGECFVFDHRASVDQQLKPSTRYALCPHCGDPGDQLIDCPMCDVSRKICHRCKTNADRNTCSKNCAERWRRAEAKKVGV